MKVTTRSFAPFPTRRGGTQAGHPIDSGGREARTAPSGVFTPTSAPVSDQEEGLCVAFSAAGRASVWSTVIEPKALLPF